MDEGGVHSNPNPMQNANFISRLFFWWLNPLFSIGYKRPLEQTDLYNCLKDDQSTRLCAKLEREWKKELEKVKHGGQPSLRRAMIRAFGLYYALLGLFVLLEESTKVVQPVLLGRLLLYFSPNSTMSELDAYLYAGGVSICAMILAISHHPYFFSVQRVGMWLRIASCSLLYKKSLRLSNAALLQTTTGQIVNLMSNDVNRFDQAVIFLHFLWVGPLQTIAVMVILWHEVGPASLAGLAVLVLLIPLQAWMGKRFSKLRAKTAVQTDERVKIMNEIISGMRVIKMYCWEKPFSKLIHAVRNLEAQIIRVNSLFCGINRHLFLTASMFTVYGAIISMAACGYWLSSTHVFPTILYFIIVRGTLGTRMAQIVEVTSAGRVSIDRLQKFLLLEELGQEALEAGEQTDGYEKQENGGKISNKGAKSKKYVKENAASGEGVDKKAEEPLLVENEGFDEEKRIPLEECEIVLQNVTGIWDKDSGTPTLDDVSCSVSAGQLLAVIGPVGSGKSSLLMSILDELPLTSGSVIKRGRIAYVSQQPWVFCASIRQNILFGQPFNRAKFDLVIRMSAMTKDLAMFPNGENTLVGEKGVTLSGGQRARVSLARALYYDADILLLDDPLSAVDTAVSRHLFDKCIMGYLKDKVKILVTNQLHFLEQADNIVIMKDGHVTDTGTFNELASGGIDFAALLKKKEDESKEDEFKKFSIDAPLLTAPSSSVTRSLTDIGVGVSVDSIAALSFNEDLPRQTHEEESRSRGTVTASCYLRYFSAGANCFVLFLLVLLNVLAQSSYIMSDWWLSYWSSQEDLRLARMNEHDSLVADGFNVTNVTIPEVRVPENISIFTGLVASVFLFGLLRVLVFFRVCVSASETLHNRAFASVVRAPVRFFDTNPVGRILNRFAKDIGQMDDQLPTAFFDFVQCSLLVCGVVIVAGVVNPWVLIPATPLCIFFFLLRRYYLATSRDIKRLEGITRSPVFSHLSSTLQGLWTVRAFRAQDIFIREFDAHQDLHTSSWFLFLASARWLAIRLDWICALFVTSVAMCCVIAKTNLNLDAGQVGLSLTYALSMMGLFQWAVRQSAEVENQMTSVERIMEYSKLPSEAALEDPDHPPPADWPKHGIITTQNASLRYYDDGPVVLKKLNFCIRAEEKVGIVGRTGAGKSSLITLLFRLAEPDGQIHLDGVNIKELGLHDLRQNLAIIPQDPVLFSGSIRNNLDPFQEHSDDQVWAALEEVQLKLAIESLENDLSADVCEGGSNFSVGQRQLLCLARAILRHNKVLIIDEATANVDPRTDKLIQVTIREKFKQCTVLTIAHRLNTIMDSDRVMVLSEGSIVEFDHPYTLLQNNEGMFYDMVKQTGQAGTEQLMAIAKESFESHDGGSLVE